MSVPKDEPLCIATLLGLDLARILGESSAQKRMAVVWEMAAKMLNGIPPKAIFFVDNPLDVEGFRWAPRSLLAADIEGDQSVDANNPYAERKFLESSLDLTHRYTTFVCDSNTIMAELVQGPNAKGLRGRYPGFRIQVTPHEGSYGTGLSEEEALHSWMGVLYWMVEDTVLLREEETGRWYQMSDYHLSRMISKWTQEQVRQWQLGVGLRICSNTHTGRCAVIRNASESWTEAGLLVSVESEGEEFFVGRKLNVLIAKLSEAESVVADTMSGLAAQVASEKVTRDLVAQQSPIARDKLKERMQQLVSEAWEARPDFAAAAIKTRQFGDVRREGWVSLIKLFSHRISLVPTPDDQVWLVD